MISAQTPLAFVARESRLLLFRVMPQTPHIHRADGVGRHARSSDNTYIMIAAKHSTTPIQNSGE
jgi:hypothetical protein